MLIPCPHCSERALQEFIYAGAADVKRPDETASAEAWHAFLHLRTNARGLTREYWQHVYGCRSVLIVERNTQTHEIASAVLAGEAT